MIPPPTQPDSPNIPNSPNPSPDEQELIAFHLGEPCNERAIRARLERDSTFAALSEDIARTLRVFSGAPLLPQDSGAHAGASPCPDPMAAWQRLRPTLPPLGPPSRNRRLRWLWLAPLTALALLLLAAGTLLRHHRRGTAAVDSAGIVHLRPPSAAAAPGEALTPGSEQSHLDRAERWLTVVNHTAEPLDPAARAEGEHLLAENAVYLHNAELRGDRADAAVLDHLDRVLTASNHPAESGLSLRLDMNTDGLLFQIRILRQNQTGATGDSQ